MRHDAACLPRFLVLGLLCLLALPGPGQADLQLAVVRPFAVSDAYKLVRSFDEWNVHFPCPAPPSARVDLLLCFSQTLATDADALLATQTVIADFRAVKASGRQDTWHRCFTDVQALSAGLAPAADTYHPFAPGTPGWVNGPNEQFLYMARGFQQNAWGQYDAWFLMEMDCATRRSGWLTELLAEAARRAPLAVLGSFYRGDMWDRAEMPVDVHYHINGNAVYNATNPLFRSMLAKLEAEHISGTLVDAFDVRLAHHFLNSDLPPEQFGWYAGDSAVIGNYAHTPMLDGYFGGEALVHGGWLYDPWAAPTALVVSDFGEVDASGVPLLARFEEALLRGHHPFRTVIVLRPADAAIAAPYERPLQDGGGATVSFTQVARTGSAWFDWCEVPVSTDWFMYTNVYFDFGRRIDLLQGTTTGLPVVTYLNANSSYCREVAACPYSVARAVRFSGQPAAVHYDISQVVFHSQLRSQFCEAWEAWYTPPACDPFPGPTADDYMAYLAREGALALHYDPQDALERGQRDRGVPRITPHDGRSCAFPASAVNASACEYASSEATCLATAGCSWRATFGTCFLGKPPAVLQPPSVHYSIAYNVSGCHTGVLAPEVTVDTAQAEQLGLTVSALSVDPPFLVVAAAVSQPALVRSTGIVTLQTALTQPHLAQPLSFPVYDATALRLTAAPAAAVPGTPVTLTGPPGVTVEAFLDPPLPFLSPVVALSDGWTRSADPEAPATLVVDTAAAPAGAAALAVRYRLRVQAGGVQFAACGALGVELLAAPPTTCTAVVTLNQTAVRGGQSVGASVSAFSFWPDPASVVRYTWTVGTVGLPLVTTTPAAVLRAPVQAHNASLAVQVVAEDAYGRTQTCSEALWVSATPGDALVQLLYAAGCAGDSQPNFTAAASDYCLQLLMALATQPSPSLPLNETRALLSHTLAAVAAGLALNGVGEAAGVLRRLAALTAAVGFDVLDDAVQEDFLAVVDRVAAVGSLDSSSAFDFLSALAPLLTNIVAATSHVPSLVQRYGVVTNATAAHLNGAHINRLVVQAMVRVACSVPDLYTIFSASTPGNCLNATWGLQTGASLPGEYQQFQLDPGLAALLPPRVRVLMLRWSHDCNLQRDELQSAAPLARLVLLNASSCTPLPPDYFLAKGAGGVSLWGVPLVLEVPPFGGAGDGGSAGAKFAPQAVGSANATISCLRVDLATGEAVTFAPSGSMCDMTLPGAVTGTWHLLDPVVANVSVSPSPNASDSLNPLAPGGVSVGGTAGSGPLPWWAIVVPVAVVGAAAGIAWFACRHRRRRREGLAGLFGAGKAPLSDAFQPDALGDPSGLSRRATPPPPPNTMLGRPANPPATADVPAPCAYPYSADRIAPSVGGGRPWNIMGASDEALGFMGNPLLDAAGLSTRWRPAMDPVEPTDRTSAVSAWQAMQARAPDMVPVPPVAPNLTRWPGPPDSPAATDASGGPDASPRPPRPSRATTPTAAHAWAPSPAPAPPGNLAVGLRGPGASPPAGLTPSPLLCTGPTGDALPPVWPLVVLVVETGTEGSSRRRLCAEAWGTLRSAAAAGYPLDSPPPMAATAEAIPPAASSPISHLGQNGGAWVGPTPPSPTADAAAGGPDASPRPPRPSRATTPTAARARAPSPPPPGLWARPPSAAAERLAPEFVPEVRPPVGLIPSPLLSTGATRHSGSATATVVAGAPAAAAGAPSLPAWEALQSAMASAAQFAIASMEEFVPALAPVLASPRGAAANDPTSPASLTFPAESQTRVPAIATPELPVPGGWLADTLNPLLFTTAPAPRPAPPPPTPAAVATVHHATAPPGPPLPALATNPTPPAAGSVRALASPSPASSPSIRRSSQLPPAACPTVMTDLDCPPASDQPGPLEATVCPTSRMPPDVADDPLWTLLQHDRSLGHAPNPALSPADPFESPPDHGQTLGCRLTPGPSSPIPAMRAPPATPAPPRPAGDARATPFPGAEAPRLAGWAAGVAAAGRLRIEPGLAEALRSDRPAVATANPAVRGPTPNPAAAAVPWPAALSPSPDLLLPHRPQAGPGPKRRPLQARRAAVGLWQGFSVAEATASPRATPALPNTPPARGLSVSPRPPTPSGLRSRPTTPYVGGKWPRAAPAVDRPRGRLLGPAGTEAAAGDPSAAFGPLLSAGPAEGPQLHARLLLPGSASPPPSAPAAPSTPRPIRVQWSDWPVAAATQMADSPEVATPLPTARAPPASPVPSQQAHPAPLAGAWAL